MKKSIIIITVVLISICTYSQNLVKNPGFEELKAPYTHAWLCCDSFNKYVSNWLSLSLISAEIYKYDSTFLKFPSDSSYFNILPAQHSGSYMAAINTYGTNNIGEPYRSYIQGELVKPMIKGKKYLIEFSIALSGIMGKNILSNNIGVYFCVKKLPVCKTSNLFYKPQINYTDIPPITDKKQWVKLSWEYIAQDTFRYFTIGNFFSNSDTKIKKINNGGYASSYLIDDVAIVELNNNDIVSGLSLLNTKVVLNKPITLNNIYFETGKSELLQSSFDELNSLYAILKSNPAMMIQVSGHTDNVGNTGFNVTLSEDRAKAVYDYLINKGIAAARLTYIGYGSSKPIASNDTDEGKAKNRRVEIMVIKNN
jgi:OmpA-OmpF porin, OOP family